MSIIDSIITTAVDFIGTTEGSYRHAEIINLYNEARYAGAYKMTLKDPWCAAFVVAVFQKCGVANLIPCYAACTVMVRRFKEKGRFHSASYCPKRGDIIFYNFDLDGLSDHVGIVADNESGKLTVIEGNSSDEVKYRNVSTSNKYILGYGVPNYGEDPEESLNEPYSSLSEVDKRAISSFPMLSAGKTGIYVKILQVLLNFYNNSSLEIDGDFGEDTKGAVISWQTKKNLEIDGIVGKQSWSSFFA